MKQRLFIIIIPLLCCLGCKKENSSSGPANTEQYGSVKFTVSYQSGNQPLVFDTLMYQNASGNKYSVTRLQYFLSDFRFVGTPGNIHLVNKVVYLDAANGVQSFTVDSIPPGNYQLLQFSIGVNPENNVSNTLPNTIENINMTWPEEMGGGYHFLKLEGHYINSAQAVKGFTMHLGTSPMLVNHNAFVVSLNVGENTTSDVSMQMDINEWFTNTYNYDFNREGNYTMGDTVLMKLIRDNGKDVFKIN